VTTPDTPRIVVAVGTDHHPFDRLVGWVDRWAGAHPEVPVLVQRSVTAPTTHARSVDLIAYDDLMAAMAGADVVVAQGGPATIMDARARGHRPIVIPRQGSLGEHVDDHQVRFTAWMVERDLVTTATTEDELGGLLDRAVADPTTFRIPPDGGEVEETITAFRRVVEPLLGRRRR
jgi:UDP-N-acetylglucosamine transferase subunit ALG13